MPSRATTISTLLVDDEQLARDELAFLLKDYPDLEVVATAENGLEALSLIEECEPDLVFLDVQMPGLDGLGIIRKLREKNVPLPAFVLATAYDDYAVDAFGCEALDYLLKPIDSQRLAQTVERARRVIEERQEKRAAAEAAAAIAPETAPSSAGEHRALRTKLLVRSGSRNYIVDSSELIYASIQDGTITVVTGQLEGVSNYRTIEELQSNLAPELFWRVHRSYLVNIDRIREVIPWFKSSYQLRMDDKRQTEIPVSRVQTKRLRALLKL
jgi:two-component system, LytTR family, response regulator LytT